MKFNLEHKNMKTVSLFQEYVWLLNVIRRSGKISLTEINDKWVQTEMSGGIELSRTTFNRHKDAIFDLFGVYIECDRKDGYRYYIGNPEVLERDDIRNWMLSTLTVGNILEASRSLWNRILLENVPTNDDFLRTILHAMKINHRITVLYRTYGSPQSSYVSMNPYALKLFHQRWYLLGKINSYKWSIFSLDRIEKIQVQHAHFTMDKDFEAKSYFEDCYGIASDREVTAEHIVIRAYGNEKYYLRDLPLHRSQREIKDMEDYADFELFVKPMPDFISYLISRGSRLQVLSPASLAEKLATLHLEAAEIYKKK